MPGDEPGIDLDRAHGNRRTVGNLPAQRAAAVPRAADCTMLSQASDQRFASFTARDDRDPGIDGAICACSHREGNQVEGGRQFAAATNRLPGAR